MRVRRFPPRRLLLAALTSASLALAASAARGAECGGPVPCACGDRIVVDTTLAADLGPCPWPSEDADELVGIRVDSGVTLDCAGFAIRGPADARKEEFGIKIGSESRPVDGATVRNCEVTGFWWGIHVTDSTAIVLEDNEVHHNGWKDPTQNGTGYGIDVARSSDVRVLRNAIEDNGNEGLHVSHSTGVEIVDNVLVRNGFEQLYLIATDDSVIHDNVAVGGTQGLEMRSSSRNAFSYNHWLASPLHWLEDDNRDNTFLYEEFEGTLKISGGSTGSTVSFARFTRPTGTCLDNRSDGTAVDRPWFASCKKPLETTKPITLDRPVRPGKLPSGAVALHSGCNADVDGDGVVGGADASLVESALGSLPGGGSWDPAADLDRDGAVTAVDRVVVDWQQGACPESNAAPKARLEQRFLEKPVGQPALVRLSAEPSSDRDGILVEYTIEVVDRLGGDLVWRRSWGAVDPATVFDERTYPVGAYQVLVTVRDAHWESSKQLRKSFKVK